MILIEPGSQYPDLGRVGKSKLLTARIGFEQGTANAPRSVIPVIPGRGRKWEDVLGTQSRNSVAVGDVVHGIAWDTSRDPALG